MTPAGPLLNGTLWPVLKRELQAGARQEFNHRLRLVTASVGTLTLFIFFSVTVGTPVQLGERLFKLFNGSLLMAMLVVMPGITADCIAREKREGTLGLLFLTPLTASGVVIGKVFAQVLRGFSFGLACLPMLAISFLLGGVTASNAIGAAVLHFNAAVLGLAAGILASSMARTRMLAFSWAGVFTALFVGIFSKVLMSCISLVRLTGINGPELNDIAHFLPGVLSGDIINAIGQASVASQTAILLGNSLVSLLLLWLAFRGAAIQVERSWQDQPISARQESWIRRWCTPLLQGAFQRKRNRLLGRNPIAWLQVYSWKSRATRWGLCLVLLLITVGVRLATNLGVDGLERLLLFVLSVTYTFVGVHSFLEEKKNGVLELLLITPLKVHQLVIGRALGLWKLFFPAALLLVLLEAANLWSVSSDGPYLSQYALEQACYFGILLLSMYLSLPFLATYFALRVKKLIGAAVLTWVFLLIAMAFALSAGPMLAQGLGVRGPAFPLCVMASYCGLVLLVCFILHHTPSRRISW